jgi:hypothetical protein
MFWKGLFGCEPQVSPLARSAVSVSAALLRDTWPQDEAVCLTFMLALGSNARPQEGNSSTTAVWRRNLITLVAQLALTAGHSRGVRAAWGQYCSDSEELNHQ